MNAPEPDDESGKTFGLVMPFVVCASNGGTLDDQSFVAGYECGSLATQLAETKPERLISTVYTVNVPQLDLIAMQHGYRMVAEETEFAKWTGVEFERVTDA